MEQLILGDCLEEMKEIPDKNIDCVITDPPYGIDYQSSWKTDKTQWKPKIMNDEKPFIEWLPDCFRIMKPGGGSSLFLPMGCRK